MVPKYHKGMIIPRQEEVANSPLPGRVAQKERTRRDLLASARKLVTEGTVPTVEDAADAAGISRTTAYRYFSSQDSLLSEASVEPFVDEIAAIVRDVDDVTDPVQRVDEVFRRAVPIVLSRAAELQTMLRITLGRSLRDNLASNAPLQSLRWLQAWDPILEPLRDRVPPPIYVLMTRSLSALLGIEAVLALKDAADGDPAGTTAAVRFAARALARGFLSAPVVTNNPGVSEIQGPPNQDRAIRPGAAA